MIAQMIMPMPIYTHSVNSAPMTEHDWKVMTAILIILTIIWIFTSAITIINYIKNRKYNTFFDSYIFNDDYIVAGLYNAVMIVIYAVIIIGKLSLIIAELI